MYVVVTRVGRKTVSVSIFIALYHFCYDLIKVLDTLRLTLIFIPSSEFCFSNHKQHNNTKKKKNLENIYYR